MVFDSLRNLIFMGYPRSPQEGLPLGRRRRPMAVRSAVCCPRRRFTGKDKNQAAEDLRRISTAHPEVKAICFDFKFPGRGQRDTPVTDAKGIVDIIMLQSTKRAARVRRQAAELLCRYLGVDLALVDEVCRLRGFQ